jgi:dTDP-4-amino-4,6-dideoxygalactose transaminase
MKTRIEELAIFGASPAFEEKLHVGRPNIGNRERLMARIGDILDRKWLTNNGAYVQEFEKRVAEKVGSRHCIAMCNGTVALEIATRALGLSGEVIVPSFTFIATAHALQWQEITPVFCDIDPKTHNIDPDKVAGLITPRTTGIIGVHLWGRACGMEALDGIAGERGLKLVFDASHAFGCTYNGESIARIGDAHVFSFHATKLLNTFEGGAVVTDRDDLAAKVRLMKNFGFSGYDSVIYIGTNGKMNEVSAAMGLTGLECLDDLIAVNRRVYREYRRELAGVKGVRLIRYDERERCNYQYIVLEVDPDVVKISRDRIVDILHAENVVARRYFHPGCHRMEPYRSFFPHAGLLLPETENVAGRVLCLPAGTSAGEDQVATICAILRTVIRHGRKVSARLEKKRVSPAPSRAR